MFFKNVWPRYVEAMTFFDSWAAVFPFAAAAVPLTFLVTALLAGRRAVGASAFSFGLALVAGGGVWATGAQLPFLKLDAVAFVMLLLVCFIGLVICRYSLTALAGERGVERYLTWLLLTLAAVTTLVTAHNLAVIALAWTGTSVCLHHLLTHYDERPAALLAAHKKFILSRLADLAVCLALGLAYTNVGSLELDALNQWALARPDLPPTMHLACVLLAVAVALKSAQLPFHGWLTQVMEAPTPVSALLHAGVVNIGGFVMIRLSGVMAHAVWAQWLLVLVGLTTAIIATLVTTTRVSVKVALAWSTCAQMGFMLVQCGLGAWHLALLHLVAHSLYKAHTFLNAGSAVEHWRQRTLRPPAGAPSPRRLVVVTAVCLGTAWAGVWFAAPEPRTPSTWVLVTLAALSLVPFLGRRAPLTLSMGALGVAALAAGWHVAATTLFSSRHGVASTAAWLTVGVAFVVLFVVKSVLQLRPDSRLARAAYPWLFAGLYLDERLTRLTFKLWPPKLPAPEPGRSVSVRGAVEA